MILMFYKLLRPSSECNYNILQYPWICELVLFVCLSVWLSVCLGCCDQILFLAWNVRTLFISSSLKYIAEYKSSILRLPTPACTHTLRPGTTVLNPRSADLLVECIDRPSDRLCPVKKERKKEKKNSKHLVFFFCIGLLSRRVSRMFSRRERGTGSKFLRTTAWV